MNAKAALCEFGFQRTGGGGAERRDPSNNTKPHGGADRRVGQVGEKHL